MQSNLIEYARNNWLDARNFFNMKPAPQAAFRYHDFGMKRLQGADRDQISVLPGSLGSCHLASPLEFNFRNAPKVIQCGDPALRHNSHRQVNSASSALLQFSGIH
jgi:hypothetical protein